MRIRFHNSRYLIKSETRDSGTMTTRMLDPRFGWKTSSVDDIIDFHDVSYYWGIVRDDGMVNKLDV